MGESFQESDTGDDALAQDMIDVHGMDAAAVARTNARNAALAGQPSLAKSWIRVLGAIQRRQIAPNRHSA